MSVKCGIVGMPNVGKSTLFNALSQTAQAEAANYPFCTIEPNTGRVAVPDSRLERCAAIAKSAEIIPTQLEFVDIAGLVKGASQGEGLGNKFLSHIREVDAILFVLRCFEDDDVTHVEGGVDPLRDYDIILTELVLADLESLEKRMGALEKKARGNDKEAKADLALIERILPIVSEGKPARLLEVQDEEEAKRFRMLQLLTAKPAMLICNVDEESAVDGNALSNKVQDFVKQENLGVVVVSAKIESEIAALETEEEKTEFLGALGLAETGLARVIQESYKLLDLMTYFTVGPKEARAWTFRRGTTAPQAAGIIHTDFESGFIRAETIACDDYIALGGEQGAKDAGKLRLEGKDYVVQDGDILHFRFNN